MLTPNDGTGEGAFGQSASSLERWNREAPERRVNLVDRHPHFSIAPPDQQSEQSSADELCDGFHRRPVITAGAHQLLHLIAHQINQHLVQQLLYDSPAALADHRAEYSPVVVGVNEQLVTEREQPGIIRHPRPERLVLTLLQHRAQSLDSAREQIVLAVEVGVERRATNVSAIDDLLYGHGFESFFLHQRHQRRMKQLLRPLNAPIDASLLHGTLTFPNTSAVAV